MAATGEPSDDQLRALDLKVVIERNGDAKNYLQELTKTLQRQKQRQAAAAAKRQAEAAAAAEAAEEQRREDEAAAAAARNEMDGFAGQFDEEMEKTSKQGAEDPEPCTFESLLSPTAGPRHVDVGELFASGSEKPRHTNLAVPSAQHATAVRHLLSAGMAAALPGGAPAARKLFEAAAYSDDEALARGAAQALLQRCGVSPLAAAGLGLSPQTLELCADEAAAPPAAWLPSPADVLSAIRAYGYSLGGESGAAGTSRAGTSGAGNAGPSGDASSPLACGVNARLVLQLLQRLCELHSHQSLDLRLRWDETTQALLLALVHLHLDDRLQLVAKPQLAAATASLLAAVEPNNERAWRAACGTLAAQIARLGSNHRASVRLIAALPAASPRGAQLRAHAAMHALKALLGQPAQASSSDPYPSATELGALLAADLRDISGLVKRLGRRQPGGGRSGAEGGDAGGAGGLWAVLSYVQLADMVLWGQVDTAGAREPAVDAQAHQFLSLLKALYRDMQSRGLNSATVRRIRLSIQPLETTYLEVLEAGGQH